MNAQKIMDEYRNCNQRFNLHVAYHPIVFLANPVERLRSLIWCKRSKQGFHPAARIGSADIVLHRFGSSCHWVVGVAVHNLMQLKDIVLRNRNNIKAFMDDG